MESEKKFKVDIGNPRGDNITESEVEQAIRDILNWVSSNVPNFSPSEGTSDSLVANAPFALKKLFEIHDGGVPLQDTFRTIPVQQIKQAVEAGEVSINWKVSYLPFARNNEGEFLVADLSTGEVLEWSIDYGVGEQLAQSMGLYLENIRNNMLSHKYQYIDEDVGIIEGV